MAKTKRYYCAVHKFTPEENGGQHKEITNFRIHDAAGRLPEELIYPRPSIVVYEAANKKSVYTPRVGQERVRFRGPQVDNLSIGSTVITLRIEGAPGFGHIYEREFMLANYDTIAGPIVIREGSRYMMLGSSTRNPPSPEGFVLDILQFLGINGRA